MESSRGLPLDKRLRAMMRDPVNDVQARLAGIGILRNRADYLEKRALEYEESRKEWDERTMDQVQASKLPSGYKDVILDRSCSIRKALYERVRELEKFYEQNGLDVLDKMFMHGIYYQQCLGGYDRNRCEAELLTMNEMHHEAVGRFIVKLKVLLSAGTMRAEEYASFPEVVERMYYAELEEMWAAVKTVTAQMKAQAELLYAVVVSAISLLVFVYQYLIGHIDKGGTLTCSSGSFQFRATFISIVLFEGAYVWIKFRDVPHSREEPYTGYDRYDKRSGKNTIEARYMPLVRCLKSGRSGGYIYLGSCVDKREANIKYRIAASCYGESALPLEHGDGPYFQIPLMSREEIQSLSVFSDEEKKDRVKVIVSERYKQWRANHSSPDHDLYQPEINPSNFGNNRSVVLEEPSLETFPAHELPDASLQQPLEDIQAQRPAIGILTSGDHRAMRPEPAATDSWMDDVLDASPDPTNDVVPAISNEVDTGVDTQHDSDDEFRVEYSEEPSLEIFPVHELPNAPLRRSFEDIQAQRPAIGMRTSGDYHTLLPESTATDCSMDIPDALPETNDVVLAIANEVDSGVVDGNTQHDLDDEFRVEGSEEPSLETFPAHELPDASLQQPLEDIQAQRPAIGILTSGDHRAMWPEPAATDSWMDDVLDASPDPTNDVVPAISNEVDTGVVDGNTQHDSEASRSANVSSVLIPQQRSDAEAILMDMIRELQQTIKEKDQKLQKAEQEKQLMIKEKQEAEKDNHARKLMIEAKDRKIAELELANLRREL